MHAIVMPRLNVTRIRMYVRTTYTHTHTHTGPWQLQPKVAQIRVHNNLPTRY